MGIRLLVNHPLVAQPVGSDSLQFHLFQDFGKFDCLQRVSDLLLFSYLIREVISLVSAILDLKADLHYQKFLARLG